MIDIIDLNKVFDNDYEALKSVNFHIDKGDLVCLLGPSGCGKTTILNLIAGLLTPTSGDILFSQKSVLQSQPKDRNIGFVFQNYALYPHMTVLENVMFPLTVGKNKIKKAIAKDKAIEYMKLTHIEDLANKKPGQLSGGQQQRVAITRSLIQEPDILLLDEPLSNLDAKLRITIREEIRKLVKKVGITTIFVTHDQEEAMSISDKIILLNEGIIQQNDNPQNLYLEPNNLFVAQFIGNPPINLIEVQITDQKLNLFGTEMNISALNQQRIKKPLVDGVYQLGVRPEDFQITNANSLCKAHISEQELIGRDRILKLTVQNQHLKALTNIEQKFENNKEIDLAINFDKAFIFTEQGERVY